MTMTEGKADERIYAVMVDCGLDDAVCLAYLLRQKRLSIGKLYIIPVAGNVTREQSATNAEEVVSHNSIMPVAFVDSGNIAQAFHAFPEIHGKDGLGDIFTARKPQNYPKIGLDEWINGVASKAALLTVINCSPCTVLKYVIERLPARIDAQYIMMGGTLNGTANYLGSEFNCKLDEEAFWFCAEQENCSFITLENCREDCFGLLPCDLANFPQTNFLSLAKTSVDLAMKRGRDRSYIYDFILALAIVHPEFFEICKHDLNGKTYRAIKRKPALTKDAILSALRQEIME